MVTGRLSALPNHPEDHPVETGPGPFEPPVPMQRQPLDPPDERERRVLQGVHGLG